MDLDLGGEGSDEALIALTSASTPAPSFVVNSGYGLHAVWLLREPSRDKARWRVIQHAIVRAFADYAADPACAPDEARVLRLVPYPNRKLSPEGVPTALVMESGTRYELAHLLDTFAPPAATRLHDIPGPAPPFAPPPEEETAGEGIGEGPAAEDLTVERMEELVETTAAVRALLDGYIRTMFKPGLHYGIIPVDSQTNSKPTLLKVGAEMIIVLFRWRAHFSADIETVQLYGPGTTGVFAYVCQLIDRQGQVVGQGRGVAELRETSLTSANMAVKMAEKRAFVDAVLRAAGLSQYFTQDLEDTLLLPPSEDAPEAAPPAAPAAATAHGVRLCTQRQRQAIRALLGRAGQTSSPNRRRFTDEQVLVNRSGVLRVRSPPLLGQLRVEVVSMARELGSVALPWLTPAGCATGVPDAALAGGEGEWTVRNSFGRTIDPWSPSGFSGFLDDRY